MHMCRYCSKMVQGPELIFLIPSMNPRFHSDLEAGNVIEFSGDLGINLMSGEVRVSSRRRIRCFMGC